MLHVTLCTSQITSNISTEFCTRPSQFSVKVRRSYVLQIQTHTTHAYAHTFGPPCPNDVGWSQAKNPGACLLPDFPAPGVAAG